MKNVPRDATTTNGRVRLATIPGFSLRASITRTKIASRMTLIASSGGLMPPPTSTSSAIPSAARQTFISPRIARAVIPIIAGSVPYVSSQTICACELSATYMLNKYATEPATRAVSPSHGATERRQ